MIIYSEQEIDKSRQEFSDSQKEYQEALDAYEADSVHLMAEYQRIQAEIEAAEKRHEPSEKIEALQDSLKYYDKPEFHPRGHMGVNIGAAIFVLFILISLIPFGFILWNIIENMENFFVKIFIHLLLNVVQKQK